MDKEPSEPQDLAPAEPDPEEPVKAVPTNETTPVWAQTRPVAPAEDADDARDPTGTEDEALPPAMAMEKGDPDWSESDDSDKGEATNGGAKKAPEWAQTVPTSPGEPIDEGQPVEKAADGGGATRTEDSAIPPPVVTDAPITEPPKAVAADQLKSTWPPRSDNAPAPPQETDIWPPEPPTEPAMPAWPPSSTVSGHAQKEEAEEEPTTPAQAIPSWPDSFEEPGMAGAAPAEPAATAPSTGEAKPAQTEPPVAAAAIPLAAADDTWQPADIPEPAADAAPTQPPAPASSAPPAAPTQPPATAPSKPLPAPAASTAQPAWAPGPTAAETTSAPHRESAPAMQIPSWAPRVPLAAEPGTPTWFSPKEQIPHPTTQPVARPEPKPEPPPAPPAPIAGGQLPVAPVPAPAPAAAPAQPQAAKPSWQVVQQAPAAKTPQGPTAEDRSYAEWFAWAKRGGAPASACHAAAQGAFKALSSGKDVNTAVQWATAAMSRPPENVSYARQTYCAWFALANIDLNMDQHRSHAFAGAAVQALDAGADASQAHAAGLAAAGYR